MELRRIIKPGGHIYLTIHDQATWDILPDTVMANLSFANDATEYHCNLFLGRDYIDRCNVPDLTSIKFGIAGCAAL
jgi:hypothetical protein